MDSGAHFHKCDLQTHSPRDPSWSGVKPVDPDKRLEFARRFVDACRAKGIDAVALTDHHDVLFVDFVRQAAALETDAQGKPLSVEERLVVFPGVELTLSVPCQALLLLDPDFPVDRLGDVLQRLGIDGTAAEEKSHDHPQQLDFPGLPQLHERLDQAPWLKGRYIVLPNASESGHGTLIRKGFHERYREMPCVGVYTDGPASKLKKGTLRKLGGEEKEWGNKRVAIVQTSDARSDDFKDLGKCPTWIKWAAPSAEALRQAFLAQESRIAVVPPAVPGVFLTRLSVTASTYMGPIELDVNPQYSAIIGGRGTGKSTCLEYIRWALCDQPPVVDDEDEMPDYMTRPSRLVAQTLRPVKGIVEVECDVNGIRHVVRRDSETGEVQLKVGEGRFERVRPDDVRSLLPIQAYSQRQLSNVAVRLDEITRFVTAPIRAELDELDKAAADVGARMRENYAALQRYRALVHAISRDETAAASLEEQATNLRESLPDISKDDQETLRRKPAWDAEAATVAEWEGSIDGVAEAVSAALAEVQDLAAIDSPTKMEPGSALSGVEAALRDVLQAASAGLTDVETELRRRLGTRQPLSRALAKWHREFEKFEEEYARATERSAAHESQIQQLAALDLRRRDLAGQLTAQRRELKRIGDPTRRHERLRGEWLKLQHRRSELLAAECESLAERSEGLITATVGRGSELVALRERFKAAVAGSGLRAKQTDSLFERLGGSPDPLGAWLDMLDELEAYLLWGDEAPTKRWTPRTALGALQSSDLERIRSRLRPEDILELSLLVPGDRPSFQYNIREGEAIGFEVASAGQQATALLRVLLNQPGPPLLIDQPEDDLDSQVINDIVSRIWQAKTQRQLIFSSHNANLVVNGDAELVVCCDYRTARDQSRGQIKLTGAIDIPEVRREITTVMEGGERAFRLRKEKYGF